MIKSCHDHSSVESWSGVCLFSLLFSCGLLVSMAASAANFQVLTQSADQLGEANAGYAVTRSASGSYANPAVAALSGKAFSSSILYKNSENIFSGTATDHDGTDLNDSRNTLKPIQNQWLPSIFYTQPLATDWFVSLSLTQPFSANTDYSDNSIARYFATRNKLRTINFAPSLAYQVDNKWYLGAGLSLQYLSLQADEQIDFSELIPGATTHPDNDGAVKTDMDSWGLGWQAGLLYLMDPHTTFGLSYHSSIHHRATGNSHVSIPSQFAPDKSLLNGLGYQDGSARASFDLPATLAASFAYKIASNTLLKGTITETFWRDFAETDVVFNSGLDGMRLQGREQNTTRIALGLSHRLNDQWLWRAGSAYDESGNQDDTKLVAMPGKHQVEFNSGFSYQWTKTLSTDFGMSLIYASAQSIDQEKTRGLTSVHSHFQYNQTEFIGASVNWALK